MTNTTAVLRTDPMWHEEQRRQRERGVFTTEETRVTATDTSVVVATHQLREGTSKSGKAWKRWSTLRMDVFKARKLKCGETSINLVTSSFIQVGGRPVRQVRNHTAIATRVRTAATPYSRATIRPEAIPGPGYTEDLVLDLIERTTGYRSDPENGYVVYRSIFPAFDLWFPDRHIDGLGEWTHAYPWLTEALRSRDIETFIGKAFGKTRYRKDLVKTVLATDPSVINNLMPFTGIVPIDWQIAVMKGTEGAGAYVPVYDREEMRQFRRLLREMSGPRQRSMMDSFVGGRGGPMNYTLSDAMRMLGQIRPEQFTDAMRRSRSMTELHHALVPAPRQWQQVAWDGARAAGGVVPAPQPWVAPPPPPNQEIEPTEQTKAIDAVEMDGYKFVCAVDTDMMNKWSEIMGNCIRSYTIQALKRQGIYIGAYDTDDKLIANIEIAIELGIPAMTWTANADVNTGIYKPPPTTTNTFTDRVYKLRQILGKFNAQLDKETLVTLVDGLRSAIPLDSKSINQAWGANGHFPHLDAAWFVNQGDMNANQIQMYIQPQIAQNMPLPYAAPIWR